MRGFWIPITPSLSLSLEFILTFASPSRFLILSSATNSVISRLLTSLSSTTKIPPRFVTLSDYQDPHHASSLSPATVALPHFLQLPKSPSHFLTLRLPKLCTTHSPNHRGAACFIFRTRGRSYSQTWSRSQSYYRGYWVRRQGRAQLPFILNPPIILWSVIKENDNFLCFVHSWSNFGGNCLIIKMKFLF